MKLKNINSNFFKLIKFILIIKKEVNFLNNNIKTLFLISTLVFLLVSISAISATDIENTTIKDTSSTHVITSTSCTTEKVEVSDNNKEVKDTVTKTQEKPITKTSTTTLKKDNNITKTTKDVTTRKTLKKIVK